MSHSRLHLANNAANTIYDPQVNHIHVVTWQFGWTTSSDSEMFIQHDSLSRISVTKLKMIFEHLLAPGYLRLGVSIHSVSRPLECAPLGTGRARTGAMVAAATRIDATEIMLNLKKEI